MEPFDLLKSPHPSCQLLHFWPPPPPCQTRMENKQLFHLNQLLQSTQSCTGNEKAGKMQDKSAWAAAETAFTQFTLSNPNKVRQMKGIQTKQKSNWTATSGCKAFFLRRCWREIRGVSGLNQDPIYSLLKRKTTNLVDFTKQAFSRDRTKSHSCFSKQSGGQIRRAFSFSFLCSPFPPPYFSNRDLFLLYVKVCYTVILPRCKP